ncbi:hypothetical protein NCAS_0I02160 [Naumovozyma castellii]|uniref:NADP-dependent oxidoreductase domain-containing protein n=1 Tax=Naumovozyma castellii TaxID=27288 RepID=G0VK50_NAUCA|nr:hypothetical protein NCAS_0I02160 [Naumovozyma castellii CBS 4309]CCC71884.1 hypothetical protein NCAS_0I02160 [Naumovozyma castellii CBS 4309]
MGLVKQVRLGNTGLKISPILIGCMSYGDKEWADWLIDDKEEIFKILKYCYDRGLRTYDTADVYSNGLSERLLGEFLKRYKIKRETVVIFTKVFCPVDETLPLTHGRQAIYDESVNLDLTNQKGLSRKHIVAGVANSVERLGTYVDVLQIHRLDHETSMEEIMRSLNDVILSGQVRYIGASSMRATEFAELQFIAEKNGWFKFVSSQSYYNLLNREDERELIPFAKKHGIGLVPWSPNARGILTRPLDESTPTGRSDNIVKKLHLNALMEDEKEIVKRVQKIAQKKSVSMAMVSIAWSIKKGCNPIVGLSSISRAAEAIGALDVHLTEEEVTYLEETYQPKKPVN